MGEQLESLYGICQREPVRDHVVDRDPPGPDKIERCNGVPGRACVRARQGDLGSPEQIVEGLKITSVFSGRSVQLAGDCEISEIRHRQTDSFRPGSLGCKVEVDCHFRML